MVSERSDIFPGYQTAGSPIFTSVLWKIGESLADEASEAWRAEIFTFMHGMLGGAGHW